MSLHLGNLSSRVRRDELERVFRRFGRCSIQVGDKFGFVVYDYPVNAERALKTLRGKKICGELLTLTWSNRQPRPVPRVRGGKSYDSRHGRKNSRIENYVKRKLPSDGQQDSRMAYQQPDEPNNNLLENDRWENELENVSEFDRYEPYNDEDKRADDEINHDVRQGEDFQQRNGDVTRKTRQGCYNCGELGHKRRNCPQEREPKKKLNRFDYKRNDNGTNNERMKRTREIRSPERHHERKSRRPNSNPIHSDAKVSKYSKPTTGLASNPNLKSCSSSSSSSSSSRSHSRRSRNHRWRSRSRSRSRSGSSSDASLNVSTSCGRSSTPSPSKLQQSSEKDSFTKATSPQQKEVDTMDTNHIKKCEEDRNSDLDGGVSERGTAMVNDEKRSRVIITSEEMLMVIKHYGLKKDDDYDDDDDKESFFGCGRLWPWEVIYYRRLKKGPISRENYARRISQNQEFGIVDRYVRSSSGWGEVVDQTL